MPSPTIRYSQANEQLSLVKGWTSLHHATYFRGTFSVAKSGVYITNFNSVVSFKIDDRAYVGNIYNYGHAAGSAIWLSEGEHKVYICAIMDVRLFGGQVPPQVQFSGKFVPVDLTGPNKGIVVFQDDTIVPEALEGNLVTPLFSITVMNTNITGQHLPHFLDLDEEKTDRNKFPLSTMRDGTPHESLGMPSEQGWVQVYDVRAKSSDGTKVEAYFPSVFSIKLAPGQIYPLPIEIYFNPEKSPAPPAVQFELDLIDLDTLETFTVQAGEYAIEKKKWGEAYKITFMDYDNVVQYAMAKPPKQPCTAYNKRGRCPVVLALHGSGVEVSSAFWTDAYKPQNYAWILYPSGRTPWGFDWHGPSYKNVNMAVTALSHMHGVPEMYLKDYKVDEQKLVYTGHSNGGQGAWWLTSHEPDKALAAVPSSGYLKIQFYTPYYMRVGDAFADPVFRGIMESSIAENDLDLYAANMAGVPILARTGGNDDNVPPLNTRRVIRLVNEWNRNPGYADISEIPGQGHWFDGVVDDDEIQQFLDEHLDPEKNPNWALPPIPDAFTISTLNPATTGSKGSIKILQLIVPYRLATIRVHRLGPDGSHWVLNTTNVRRFGFLTDDRAKISSWSIDGQDFNEPPKIGPTYLKTLKKAGDIESGNHWVLVPDLLWISTERYSSTYGPVSQILTHPFLIVIPSKPARPEDAIMYRRAAQHLATSWYLYGRGGTQIVNDVDVRDGMAAKYHLIVLGGSKDNLFSKRREKEGGAVIVKFLDSGGFQIATQKYQAPGTGILFLAPSSTRTLLGLFVAGVDQLGFQRALWTIPFRTGLMIPDYMVVGDEYGDAATGWTAGDGHPYNGAGTKGMGGVLAAGYWGNDWQFDSRCGYTK
ncbi:hypothetical protein HDV05_006128 [Chytridiales sp. JEL 0842]|nr:hypothetical protein HDV05_006128 [Chytridiales sp. JEL 0842]